MTPEKVNILTNSQPHDMVLQQRGKGLQSISDLNAKGVPLHVMLLFLQGKYGSNLEEKHILQSKIKQRVATRKF